MMAIFACSPANNATFTPIPTQTLIPSTPTNTPVIPTATNTPVPPLLPGDLVTNIPVPLITLEAPEERRIAQIALDQVMNQTRTAPELIRLAHMQPTLWSNADLDCEAVDDPPTQETDGYWVVFVVGSTIYQYHTDTSDDVRLCDETDVRRAEGELLVLADPVAAELVALARRRLATEFDLPSRRVQLVEASVITWPDTSLGCPAPGQSYETLDVDGYRIVMSVAEQNYIFHTNFDRLILCEPENEVLP